MAKKEINPNTLLAAGAVALVFFGGRAIFEKLGIVKSKEEQQTEDEIKNQMLQLSTGNYFDQDYWKKGGAGTLILTAAGAAKYADIIYNAKGIFNDDEAAVYGVFQALKTRSQVSYLSMVFFQKYNKSLIAYLADFLNKAELATVARICNKLPNFKV
jgi:hypothetical protein